MADQEVVPKAFISYSWTTPEHEAWVEALAVELEEAGVEVILDKWDLHPGHDAIKFMEQMIADPTVTKVIMVCDKVYAEKADDRKGGAGTEAQIISPEIYRSAGDQNKFVAVIRENDENGQACRPVFARGRIHIDFTDDADRARSFDQLIRWVYGKPLHVRPVRGKRPAYLDDEEGKVRLGTSSEARRAIDALRNSRPNGRAAASDYFRLFAEELEKLRLQPDQSDRVDQVLALIEQTPPFRDEALDVIFNLVRYADSPESWDLVGSFFEALIKYDDWPEHVQGWSDIDADQYHFLIREILLHCMAFALAERRFGFAKHLLTMKMFYKNRMRGKSELVGFAHMNYHPRSIEIVNGRSKPRYYNLFAKMLRDRAAHSTMKAEALAQADFVFYLKSIIEDSSRWGWFPLTAAGSMFDRLDMELFTRARSKQFLAQILDMLGVDSKDDLVVKVAALDNQQLPTLGYERLYPLQAMKAEELGTQA